jgi:formylglycine-generating enzyme required for sulfatase activity
MRLVPGGPRLMGGTIVKRAGWQNPQLHAPRVEVELSPFHADERPITRRQLRAWLDATDPRVQPPLTGPPDAPAVVSWEDAAAYAAWVGGRLPTEAEWEALRDAGHVSDDGWEWCADAWHPEFVKFAPRRDPVNRWTADRGHVVRQPEARSVGGGRGRFRVVTDVTGGGR